MSLKCSKYRCGEELVEVRHLIGKITWYCPACELNKQGLCRDCKGKLPPKKCKNGPAQFRCNRCRTIHENELARQARKKRFGPPLGRKIKDSPTEELRLLRLERRIKQQVRRARPGDKKKQAARSAKYYKACMADPERRARLNARRKKYCEERRRAQTKLITPVEAYPSGGRQAQLRKRRAQEAQNE